MRRFLIAIIASSSISLGTESPCCRARFSGREILAPAPSPVPRTTGALIFWMRPGKPILFRISATGGKPLTFITSGLPTGFSFDSVTGRTPSDAGDVTVTLSAGSLPVEQSFVSLDVRLQRKPRGKE